MNHYKNLSNIEIIILIISNFTLMKYFDYIMILGSLKMKWKQGYGDLVHL